MNYRVVADEIEFIVGITMKNFNPDIFHRIICTTYSVYGRHFIDLHCYRNSTKEPLVTIRPLSWVDSQGKLHPDRGCLINNAVECNYSNLSSAIENQLTGRAND